jgi:hypothetical protein
MVTDQQTLDDALYELNTMIYMALEIFNSKQEVGTSLNFIETRLHSTGNTDEVPIVLTSMATLITDTETINGIIEDYV